MQKYVLKLGLLFVLVLSMFTLVGCGEDTPDEPVGPAVIEVFDFKESSYELELGATLTVELNIDSNADMSIVQYSSKDSNIATFNKGILKGVAVGETEITISYVNETNNLTKTVSVKVKLTAEEQANYDAAKE